MSSRHMSLLPRATLHSDSEQLLLSIISPDYFMIFWINSHIPQLFHDIFVPISSAVSRYRGHIATVLRHLFPTRLLTSEDEYKWYWHQMIYFPETINTVSTRNTLSLICFHSSLSSCAHYSLQKPWWSRLPWLLVVFPFCHVLSRLSSSLVWAQLTLLIPAMGSPAPSSQDGAPIHRVRAPSLTGIRNNKHIAPLEISPLTC
jgi:hypothetical protein